MFSQKGKLFVHMSFHNLVQLKAQSERNKNLQTQIEQLKQDKKRQMEISKVLEGENTILKRSKSQVSITICFLPSSPLFLSFISNTF